MWASDRETTEGEKVTGEELAAALIGRDIDVLRVRKAMRHLTDPAQFNEFVAALSAEHRAAVRGLWADALASVADSAVRSRARTFIWPHDGAGE